MRNFLPTFGSFTALLCRTEYFLKTLFAMLLTNGINLIQTLARALGVTPYFKIYITC